MTWQDMMMEAVAEWLRTDCRIPNVKQVLSLDQTTPSEYYCDTCGPDPITVYISYLTHSGENKSYTFYGDLGELMRGIT